MEEIVSLPYAYTGNETVCQVMGFIHAYSGLANIVAMWLLTLYYANYVYLSLDSIQRFVQHKRYTRIAVFIFPLITALPLSKGDNSGGHDDDKSYGKDHQIWCAFEAKDENSTLWIIMVYYLWAWLFILLSLGIVFYVIFSIQQQVECGFCRSMMVCLRNCWRNGSKVFCCCGQSTTAGGGEEQGLEDHILSDFGHSNRSTLEHSHSRSIMTSPSRSTHVVDTHILSKVFSTIGIYVMITLASWIPRTFRRFSAFLSSGSLDFSSQEYLLLTLPIYFIGIAYSILFVIDPSPLKLPDVRFGDGGGSRGSTDSRGGIDMDWGDILKTTTTENVMLDSAESRHTSESR
jgi:hypothetical protein